MRPVILASASPRRHELLGLGGVVFEARPASALEIPLPGEAPTAFVRRMSRTKAVAAAEALRADGSEPSGPAPAVIGADTIVVLDESILGKPEDAAHARALLRRLRGRTHEVFTAVTVLDTADGAEHADCVRARVPMRAYSDAEIDAYVATGNPLDKAGAYAIQYGGFQPVDLARFADCFANVMGLPVCRLLRLLQQVDPELTAIRQPGDCARFDARACPVYEAINKESAI